MKKILSIACVSLVVFSAGCFKDSTINSGPDSFGANSKSLVQITYSGLEYFSSATLLIAGGTTPVTFPVVVNLASTNTLSTNVNVTLAVNDAARTSYNTSSAVQFVAMPDSDYTFTTTTGSIKAGSRLDTFYVTFDPTKIDFSQNYMLPIALTTASGATVSTNFNTVYFHIIGNPLAGNYTWTFSRWPNNIGPASGPPDATSFTDEATFLPDDPTTVEMPTGYYTQRNYVMTFDNNGGTLSNFAVVPSATMLSDFSGGGITIVVAPHLLIADPVAKHFQVQMTVFNGSAYRYIIDDFQQ